MIKINSLLTHGAVPSVVGQDEFETNSVNVRNRDDVGTKARTETLPLDVITQKLVELKKTRSLSNKLA